MMFCSLVKYILKVCTTTLIAFVFFNFFLLFFFVVWSSSDEATSSELTNKMCVFTCLPTTHCWMDSVQTSYNLLLFKNLEWS